jgi:hypothetical protein
MTRTRSEAANHARMLKDYTVQFALRLQKCNIPASVW